MREAELRERLRELSAPDETDAQERAWGVVGAAFAEREPAPRRAARLRPVLVTATVTLAVGAAALTPPGEAVADWVRDVLHPGRRDARPALVRLPAPGRLLVTSRQGAWVVNDDGSRRRLGDYEQAAWSPHGKFVAVTRGRELTAVDPHGRVRWSLARPTPVADPRWSPSGLRIAYRSGRSLRVVYGDGAFDSRLRSAVVPVAPAWRPGPRHVLAFAAGRRVVVADADHGRRLWSVAVAGPVAQLDWTPRARTLVVRTTRAVQVYAAGGRLVAETPLTAAGRVVAAALSPDGRTLAVARRGRTTGEVVALRLSGPDTASRTLFRGAGTFSDLAWSPDGRWLLIAWRDADQWLFVRSAQVRKITAVSAIDRAFAPGRPSPQPFPALAGWCCVPSK
jgi:WD40 repeat protein